MPRYPVSEWRGGGYVKPIRYLLDDQNFNANALASCTAITTGYVDDFGLLWLYFGFYAILDKPVQMIFLIV